GSWVSSICPCPGYPTIVAEAVLRYRRCRRWQRVHRGTGRSGAAERHCPGLTRILAGKNSDKEADISRFFSLCGSSALLILLLAPAAAAAPDPTYAALRAARPDGRTVAVKGLTLERDAF